MMTTTAMTMPVATTEQNMAKKRRSNAGRRSKMIKMAFSLRVTEVTVSR